MSSTSHWKQDTDFRYTMQTRNQPTQFEKVDKEKDLGVTVDSQLNFRDRINTKVNLANRNLGIIFRTSTYLDQEVFLNLFKSLVRPHLEYCTPVWSPCYKKHRIIFENVQRRATKLVASCRKLSYPERLRKLGLPTLESRRERVDLIQVFKILNGVVCIERDKLENCGDLFCNKSLHILAWRHFLFV